jgi:pimeloyl-ACP methyl ester carboxylesterase
VVPTLVLSGDLDLDDMRSNAQHLATRAQNARFVGLAGVAHLPMLEDPDSFGAVVRAFLDSL